MAEYDIAAGITNDGLSKLVADFYAVSSVREHLFKGGETMTTKIGDVTYTYDLQSAPVVRLSGPTDAEWANAHGADPAEPLPPRPTEHAVTVTLNDLQFSFDIAGVLKTTKGAVQAFGVVTTATDETGKSVKHFGTNPDCTALNGGLYFLCSGFFRHQPVGSDQRGNDCS